MGATAAIMGGMAVLSAVDSADQARMAKIKGEFDSQQMIFNSKMVDFQKRDVLDQAKRDVITREEITKKMIGAQRASLAAQNIDVNGEMGQLAEREERRISMQDVNAIKNNAWREAMGLEVKRADLLAQAGMAKAGGYQKAGESLAAGFSQAVGFGVQSYKEYKGNKNA